MCVHWSVTPQSRHCDQTDYGHLVKVVNFVKDSGSVIPTIADVLLAQFHTDAAARYIFFNVMHYTSVY